MKKSTTKFAELQIRNHRCVFMWAAIHRKITKCLLAVLWLAFLPINGSAAVISFTPSLVGVNQWMYAYTATVLAGDPSVDEFTIFFDPGLYANLAVAVSPLGWDPLVIQPDAGIPADGFFDALALVVGISPGASQGGFAVSFDFLGTGTPGTQRFDIVDPNTFATLNTGFTSVAVVTPPPPTSSVPEPNALMLTCLALALFLCYRRQFPVKN